MSQTSYPTWLPLFTGFYQTRYDDLECTDERTIMDDPGSFILEEPRFDGIAHGALQGLFMSHTDFRLGYSAVGRFLSEKVLPALLPEWVASVKYEQVVFPREYNFRNDSVNCTIVLHDQAVAAFCHDNKAALDAIVGRRYRIRDGFIPYHPDKIDEWCKLTRNFRDFSADKHYCGAMLEFMAEIKYEGLDEARDAMHEKAMEMGMEDVYCENAVFNIEAALKEWETTKNDSSADTASDTP